MFTKKLFIGILSFSNLAVLSLVCFIYLQNNYQTSKMYSSNEIGTKESVLKEKIKKQCGKELEKVIKGSRVEFICNITMRGQEKGSSYVLKTRVTLKKTTDGFTVKGLGSMNSKTRYATEADFCENCGEEFKVISQDKETIFGQIFDIAQTIDQKAASSVINAQEIYRKKNLQQRNALLKKNQCKGEWNEQEEEYIEYAVEKILICKITKLDNKDFFQKENYYNNTLKKDLWDLALSDDYKSLEKSSLQMLQAKLRNNISVQSSTNTISRYLDWKSKYEDEGLTDQVQNQINEIMRELKYLSRIDTSLATDYNYLSQNHEVESKPLYNPTNESTPLDSLTNVIETKESLKNQVQDLY